MNAIETLISVLCGPEGKCCISGSDDDRRLIDSALAEIAQAAQADSVQEDAARYRWLRRWKGQEHEPPFTVQHEIDGTLWGGDLDAAIDAAMNKGGAA